MAYPPEHFEFLSEIEERHFWHVARSELIRTVVAQVLPDTSKEFRMLEIGCGTGNVLRGLEGICPPGSVFGMDLFDEGLQHAKRRGSSAVVRGDVYNPPLGPVFQIVGAFDVIEHLADDSGALRSIRRLVADNGTLVLTVPAGPELWSYWDVRAGHYRRYTRESLCELIESCGFAVDFVSFFMMCIYPAMRVYRQWIARYARASTEVQDRSMRRESATVPVVNEVLTALLRWEARWVAGGRRLPAGASLLAIAKPC